MMCTTCTTTFLCLWPQNTRQTVKANFKVGKIPNHDESRFWRNGKTGFSHGGREIVKVLSSLWRACPLFIWNFCFCLGELESERWCCRNKMQNRHLYVFVSLSWFDSTESLWWPFDFWGLLKRWFISSLTEVAAAIFRPRASRQRWRLNPRGRGVKWLGRNASSCLILSSKSELASPLISVNLFRPENGPVTAFEEAVMRDMLGPSCWRRAKTITSLSCYRSFDALLSFNSKTWDMQRTCGKVASSLFDGEEKREQNVKIAPSFCYSSNMFSPTKLGDNIWRVASFMISSVTDSSSLSLIAFFVLTATLLCYIYHCLLRKVLA